MDNRFTGTILEVVYQGEFVELLVALASDGPVLHAHVDSRIHQRHRFAPKRPVTVGWNARRSNGLTV